MSEGLGARLREARERRHIDIAAIAASTKVSPALYEGLERDDVSRWPAGIFRRSFVRDYAQAIGLDPEATLREFLEQFPEPLAQGAAAPTDDPTPRPRRPPAILRLTLADDRVPYGGGRMLADIGRRCAAVVLDGGVVLGIAFGLSLVLGAFWMSLGSFALAYYVAATLFLGNTPGVWLFGPEAGGRRGGSSRRRREPAPPPTVEDPDYDRGIGAIASVTDPA